MIANIYLCTSLQCLATQIDPNVVKVFIGDCGDIDTINQFGAIPASLYNPPFEAISAKLDGNTQAFDEMYFKYLIENKDVEEFSIALVRTIMMGNTIILYMNNEECELYFNTLATYFRSCFGLDIGFIGLNQNGVFANPGNMNDQMYQNMLGYLYLVDEVPVDVFLRLYVLEFSPDMIEKLKIDKGMEYINVLNCNQAQYNTIFNNVRQNIVSHGHKKSPLIRGYDINANVQ